jgi:hypothetical protein
MTSLPEDEKGPRAGRHSVNRGSRWRAAVSGIRGIGANTRGPSRTMAFDVRFGALNISRGRGSPSAIRVRGWSRKCQLIGSHRCGPSSRVGRLALQARAPCRQAGPSGRRAVSAGAPFRQARATGLPARLVRIPASNAVLDQSEVAHRHNHRYSSHMAPRGESPISDSRHLITKSVPGALWNGSHNLITEENVLRTAQRGREML